MRRMAEWMRGSRSSARRVSDSCILSLPWPLRARWFITASHWVTVITAGVKPQSDYDERRGAENDREHPEAFSRAAASSLRPGRHIRLSNGTHDPDTHDTSRHLIADYFFRDWVTIASPIPMCTANGLRWYL
jgi:hypothetical protein